MSNLLERALANIFCLFTVLVEKIIVGRLRHSFCKWAKYWARMLGNIRPTTNIYNGSYMAHLERDLTLVCVINYNFYF